MEKYVIKFNFLTPVHFGDLEQLPNNFSNTDYVLQNDTIFSALMIEAINMYGEEKVKDIYDTFLNDCKISSMMPYIQDTYFLPKPLLEDKRTQQDDINISKTIKNLRFLPAIKIKEYVKILNNEGSLKDFVTYNEDLYRLGKYNVSQKVAISRNNEDNLPWSLGTFTFSKNCGVYMIIVANDKEKLDNIINLFKALQYDGIGGRRSSGYGHFNIELINLEETKNLDLIQINSMLDLSKLNYTKDVRLMTLSLFLPDELKEDDLKDSCYKIVRRSGFVSSTNFSEEFVKKDDVYAFMVGSTFTKLSKSLFSGQILDVSNNKGSHKVYKHLVPLFLGVENE